MFLIKLFIITLYFVSITEARNINYIFDIQYDHINVALDVESTKSCNSKFYIPMMFIMEGEYPKLNIKIDSIKTNYDIDTTDYSISIDHKPYAKIQIFYELHNFKNHYSNLYFTINKNHFFFFSNYCLMLPEIPKNELNDINFKFLSYKYPIISNIENINNEFILHDIKISDLRPMFFGGGNDIEIMHIPYSDIIIIGDISINKTRLVEYIMKLMSYPSNYFGQSNKNSFIFFTEARYKENIDGSGNPDFQVISLGYETKLNDILKKIILHEYLHKWFNPYVFGTNNNNGIQGSNAWFIEGVNDYYTDYLNYKDNNLSFKKYIENYNKSINYYYTSSFRFMTNNELQQNNNQIDIAYPRGRIIAHELNELIKKHTKNNLSLDDYIKYLFSLSRTKNFQFSPELLQRTLNEFTGYDFSDFIEENIIKSNLNVKAQSILNGKALITKKKTKIVYYDFDFVNSSLTWTVLGVKANSKAFKAGLRNGQKILHINETNKFIVLKIEHYPCRNIKIIKLRKYYKEIIIPQYAIN